MNSWKILKGYPAKPEDEAIEGAALYPLLDLVNHGPRPHNLQYPPDFHPIRTQFGKSPAFVMFADRFFPKHTELVWEYGPKANLELIYGYGFLLPKNPHDGFMYDISTNRYCLGTRVSVDICRFRLGPFQHDDGLLNMLRQDITGVEYTLVNSTNLLDYYDTLTETSEPENRWNLILALRKYRKGLEEYHGGIAQTWPLRIERRGLLNITNSKRRKMFLYGISEKVLLLEQLKIIDRELMQVLWRSIEVPSQ